MTSDAKPEELAMAVAAVNLTGNPPRGDQPEWHEIQAWRSGTLAEPRATEVLSHLANDPAVFQQWLDLCEAENYLAEEAVPMPDEQTFSSASASSVSSQTGSPTNQAVEPHQGPDQSLPSKTPLDWLRSLLTQPLPVYAGALAAVLLAVVLTPLLRETDASLQQQLDRNTDLYIASGAGLPAVLPGALRTRSLGSLFQDLSSAEIEQAHFQYGMHLGIERLLSQSPDEQNEAMRLLWQQWSDNLPKDPGYCAKAISPADCEMNLEPISGLGQWSLLMRIACEQEELISNTLWTQQADAYRTLRKQSALLTSERYSSLMPEVDNQTPQALCSVADALLRVP